MLSSIVEKPWWLTKTTLTTGGGMTEHEVVETDEPKVSSWENFPPGKTAIYFDPNRNWCGIISLHW